MSAWQIMLYNVEYKKQGNGSMYGCPSDILRERKGGGVLMLRRKYFWKGLIYIFLMTLGSICSILGFAFAVFTYIVERKKKWTVCRPQTVHNVIWNFCFEFPAFFLYYTKAVIVCQVFCARLFMSNIVKDSQALWKRARVRLIMAGGSLYPLQRGGWGQCHCGWRFVLGTLRLQSNWSVNIERAAARASSDSEN